VRILY